MPGKDPDSKRWFVKVGGRLAGPVSAERLQRLVDTKRVALDDEVSEDRKKWVTVASFLAGHGVGGNQPGEAEPLFSEQVDSLGEGADGVVLHISRGGQLSRELTEQQLAELARKGQVSAEDEIVQSVFGTIVSLGRADSQAWFPGYVAPAPVLANAPAPASPDPARSRPRGALRSLAGGRVGGFVFRWQMLPVACGLVVAIAIAIPVFRYQRERLRLVECNQGMRHQIVVLESQESAVDVRGAVTAIDGLVASLQAMDEDCPHDPETAAKLESLRQQRDRMWASPRRAAQDVQQAGELTKGLEQRLDAAAVDPDSGKVDLDFRSAESLAVRIERLLAEIPEGSRKQVAAAHAVASRSISRERDRLAKLVEQHESALTAEREKRAREVAAREQEAREEEERKRRVAKAEASVVAAQDAEQRDDFKFALKKYEEAIELLRTSKAAPAAHVQLAKDAEDGRLRVASQLPFTVSVETWSRALGDAFPRWSVDHEVRVNGRVVDQITNTRSMATFTDVTVRVGDKISARVSWKNGYNVVGLTFAYCPETIVAEWGKTKYLIVLYEDEISWRVISK